jgi:superfamily II DNA or RNA helicase
MTEQFWIRQLDPIESIMAAPLYKLLKDELSYRSVYFQQGPFHKTRKEYMKSSFIGHNKEGYFFYSGFFPRILSFCEKNKIKIESDIELYGLTYKEPKVPEGFDPRSFQKSMVDKVIEFERGILKAPTGTGKTSLGLYIISCLDGLGNVLWLCHTKDLMHQTAKEAEKWFEKRNVGRVGDSYLELGKFFTSATRQTFIDHAEEWGTNYDMIVLDETHHLSKFDGQYADIFKHIYAPIRLGLTATLPDSTEAKLAMEAFIGPLLEDFTINQAREEGYMAKPIIRIKKISRLENVHSLRKYADVYEWGIIRRLERNKLIIDIVKEHQAKNESVLIVVTQIIHGQLLKNIGDNNGVEIEFVNGATDTETRDLTKQLLNDKKIKCVICTAVWKEGINIPELNVIINAAGGKSELVTLQSIGRGLRKTKNKSELIIYDFFDNSHHYLIDHFGARISLYMDLKWL